MDIRAVIIASSWIAVTIISVVYIWIGGVNVWNNLSVGLLVFVAFIITFGVAFGLKVERKPEMQLMSELKSIRSKLDELMKEIEEIKKAIEE